MNASNTVSIKDIKQHAESLRGAYSNRCSWDRLFSWLRQFDNIFFDSDIPTVRTHLGTYHSVMSSKVVSASYFL